MMEFFENCQMTSNWRHRASKMQLWGVKRRFARAMNCRKVKIFGQLSPDSQYKKPTD